MRREKEVQQDDPEMDAKREALLKEIEELGEEYGDDLNWSCVCPWMNNGASRFIDWVLTIVGCAFWTVVIIALLLDSLGILKL